MRTLYLMQCLFFRRLKYFMNEFLPGIIEMTGEKRRGWYRRCLPSRLSNTMKKLDKYIVSKSYSLEDTMKAIDANSMGFVVVCDGPELFGIVTDGDIRRYLLAGGALKENICSAVNCRPHFLYEQERHLAETIMNREKISAIPVVNENHVLLDIILNQEDDGSSREKLDIPLVIMAGGEGTRLRPYTNILPKPLIPVDGITITEQIMNRFGAYGCNEVYMIVNYMKSFIKSYFKEKKVNQHIHFIEETRFLGTGGGLKYMKGRVDGTFFMSNCDVLLDCSYSGLLEAHKNNGNLITMVCARKKLLIPYGTIEIGSGQQILSMKEKPEIECCVNTGVYVMEPEFLELIPEEESIHLPQLIELAMARSQKAGTYIIDESQWMDMGQMEELEQMKHKIEQF